MPRLQHLALHPDNPQPRLLRQAAERLRQRGTTLISIAHRAAVAGFHRRVLQLTGGGRWKLSQTPPPEDDTSPAEKLKA